MTRHLPCQAILRTHRAGSVRSIQCRVERSYKCQLFLAIPVLDPFSQRGHLAGPQITGHGFPGENEEKPRSLKESDSHPQGFCEEPWQFQKGSCLLGRNTAASCHFRNLHKGLLAQPFPSQRGGRDRHMGSLQGQPVQEEERDEGSEEQALCGSVFTGDTEFLGLSRLMRRLYIKNSARWAPCLLSC